MNSPKYSNALEFKSIFVNSEEKNMEQITHKYECNSLIWANDKCVYNITLIMNRDIRDNTQPYVVESTVWRFCYLIQNKGFEYWPVLSTSFLNMHFIVEVFAKKTFSFKKVLGMKILKWNRFYVPNCYTVDCHIGEQFKRQWAVTWVV